MHHLHPATHMEDVARMKLLPAAAVIIAARLHLRGPGGPALIFTDPTGGPVLHGLSVKAA